MLDAAHFDTQARRCRRLAPGFDEKTRLALVGLATEYEAKAIALAQSIDTPKV
jgi:hypothetical protein